MFDGYLFILYFIVQHKGMHILKKCFYIVSRFKYHGSHKMYIMGGAPYIKGTFARRTRRKNRQNCTQTVR